jgi:hypothetical protein
MQARLKGKDLADASFGLLGFTPREAALLRMEIAARRNLVESEQALKPAGNWPERLLQGK